MDRVDEKEKNLFHTSPVSSSIAIESYIYESVIVHEKGKLMEHLPYLGTEGDIWCQNYSNLISLHEILNLVPLLFICISVREC